MTPLKVLKCLTATAAGSRGMLWALRRALSVVPCLWSLSPQDWRALQPGHSTYAALTTSQGSQSGGRLITDSDETAHFLFLNLCFICSGMKSSFTFSIKKQSTEKSIKIMKIRAVLPQGSATIGCGFHTSASLRYQIREGEVFCKNRMHQKVYLI